MKTWTSWKHDQTTIYKLRGYDRRIIRKMGRQFYVDSTDDPTLQMIPFPSLSAAKRHIEEKAAA